jgi:parvulin-like peptidyl-prolyl isomerase
MTRSLGAFVLREPLVHFLVLGALLVMLYFTFGKTDDRASRDRIVVDQEQLSRLSQQFQRTWMRPPTRVELQVLAEDYVKEEILYREALALGLDNDDLVIRRRMRQKMEFLNADLLEQQPTVQELEDFLRAKPDSFREPPRFSFEQIYLDPLRSNGDVAQRARDLLAAIRDSAGDPASAGDSTLLPAAMQQATPRDIASTFGRDFVEAVINATPGIWTGPSTSTYGVHLVRVTERVAGRTPALADVRPVVEREWANKQRQEAEARFYAALRSRYSIEIRLPEARPDGQPSENDRLAARQR